MLGLLMLIGCSDQDVFSLTPYERLSEFTVQMDPDATHTTLQSVAQRYDVELHRNPDPQQNAIPRDYLAGILIGRCMLLAEGNQHGDTMSTTVSLSVPETESCNDKAWLIYDEIRERLVSRVEPR